jgi:hypothetical protein
MMVDKAKSDKITITPPEGGSVIRNMVVKAVFFLLALIVLAVSCATRQQDEDQFKETIAVSKPRSYTIIEHKNPSEEIPQWLRFYLDSGERPVERTDYTDNYIFVITEKGSGLAALEKWSEYFRIEQDFSQAVFLRMYNRLIAESQGRPDYYLGDFFEVFLKKIAGHIFEGASREDGYWIKISFERFAGEDGVVPDGDGRNSMESADVETDEEYWYYILSKINKTSFEKEIMGLFTAAYSEVKLEKLQAGVVSKLQSALFAEF